MPSFAKDKLNAIPAMVINPLRAEGYTRVMVSSPKSFNSLPSVLYGTRVISSPSSMDVNPAFPLYILVFSTDAFNVISSKSVSIFPSFLVRVTVPSKASIHPLITTLSFSPLIDFATYFTLLLSSPLSKVSSFIKSPLNKSNTSSYSFLFFSYSFSSENVFISYLALSPLVPFS